MDVTPSTPDWYQKQVFGEMSARLIRSASAEPKIVLLDNPLRWNPAAPTSWVLAWEAPLAEPWGGDFLAVVPPFGHETNTYGYGPYIIDGFGDTTFPGASGDTESITLWHTISVWQGPGSNSPYGVYTGSEVIPW